MSKCTHSEQSGEWVDNPFHDPVEWALDGFDEGPSIWESGSTPTTEDVDTHRYRCTQCGEVMYYSNKARRHFEDGELFDIPGLDSPQLEIDV